MSAFRNVGGAGLGDGREGVRRQQVEDAVLKSRLALPEAHFGKFVALSFGLIVP